jgi:hypothetical protein
MAPVLAPMQHPLGPESMGSLLRAAFEHVTVVSLKANGHRKWFSGMLEGQLGLHPSRDFSFVDGVEKSWIFDVAWVPGNIVAIPTSDPWGSFSDTR